MKNIFFILLLCQFFSAKAQTKNDIFIAKPYLQIGHNPSPESLQLLWHTADESSVWTVELQADKSTIWTKNDEPKFTTVAVKGIAPHRVYNASLTGLKTGSTFKYKVFR
jgi:hypothetical protein